MFVSLLLLCALALASPRASSGSSSDRLSKRQPAPKYKEDASSSSIGAYKNVFKAGDALVRIIITTARACSMHTIDVNEHTDTP